jgi:hypothetical protein
MQWMINKEGVSGFFPHAFELSISSSGISSVETFFQVWMEKGSGLTGQRGGYTIRGSGVRVEGVTDMQFAA